VARRGGPVRDLYRAILQIGISYFQIERGNYRGAVKMLLRVRQWLAPLPAVCQGVDVSRLREDVERVYATLADTGPDDWPVRHLVVPARTADRRAIRNSLWQ
jgi:hypothetical protein